MKKLIFIIILASSVQFFLSCTKVTVIIKDTGPDIITPTPIKKDTVYVYILAGQSNVGRSRLSEMTIQQKTLYSGLMANTKIFNPYISDSSLLEMNVGINTMLDDAKAVDEFGCEASLFKNLQDSNPKERVLLKYGDGATTMRSFWGSRIPRLGWKNLLAYTTTVANLIIADGKIPILKTFIWMQGCGDASSESFSYHYYTRLNDFNIDFRAHWKGIITTNNLPEHDYLFVVGRINAPTAPFRNTVRTAQFDFCEIPVNKAVMIDTDSYPLKDEVHYSATGQIQFGIDIFKQIR